MISYLATYQLKGFAPATSPVEVPLGETLFDAIARKYYGTDMSAVTILAVEGPFESKEAATRYQAEQRYTDEQLTRDLTDPFPGPARAAVHLLKLDTPARRLRAVQNANTTMNLIGGTYSHRVAESVGIISRMIAEGHEGEETYSERTSREYMERERAHREVSNQALAARYTR